jgi:hypothetical protein
MVNLSATEQLISRTSLTVNNRRMFCIVHHNTMQSFQHKNINTVFVLIFVIQQMH